MKKIVLMLVMCVAILSAGNLTNKTVGSTMQLMHNGMNMIAEGFYYNDKEKIKQGIDIVENANNIFAMVDVKSFLNKKSVSLAAIKNITSTISQEITKLRKDVKNNSITKAGTDYGKVLNSCIACHVIIRKW